MFYKDKLPGNACCEEFFDAHEKHQLQFMNAKLIENECEVVTETCRLMSLSEVINCIIDPYSTLGTTIEISLLKIDAEGAEWDILSGLNKEINFWKIIRQIVLEAAFCFCNECCNDMNNFNSAMSVTESIRSHSNLWKIRELLIEMGYKVVVDFFPWGLEKYTGNVLVYARR